MKNKEQLQYISVREMAQLMGIDASTIYKQIKNNINFPKAFKFENSTKWFLNLNEVLEYIENRKKNYQVKKVDKLFGNMDEKEEMIK